MIYVEVWELVAGSVHEARTATVAWDGSRWHVNPPERAETLLEPQENHRTREWADPRRSPQLFLRTLHDNYGRGSWRWVTAPREGVPPPVGAGGGGPVGAGEAPPGASRTPGAGTPGRPGAQDLRGRTLGGPPPS